MGAARQLRNARSHTQGVCFGGVWEAQCHRAVLPQDPEGRAGSLGAQSVGQTQIQQIVRVFAVSCRSLASLLTSGLWLEKYNNLKMLAAVYIPHCSPVPGRRMFSRNLFHVTGCKPSDHYWDKWGIVALVG